MSAPTQLARWRCACCGVEFDSLPMDVSFAVPVDWDALTPEEAAGTEFDDDFCRIPYASGEMGRFIRCVLPLPVPELADEFRFGVWVSVSENSWRIYQAGFHTGKYETSGCFGYLMHQIPGLKGSLHLHCDVEFQPDRQRPRVYLHEADHPLFLAQTAGVYKTQVEAWVSLSHGSHH